MLWAIRSVLSNHLLKSCDSLSDLFAKVFPGSDTAKKWDGISVLTLDVTD